MAGKRCGDELRAAFLQLEGSPRCQPCRLRGPGRDLSITHRQQRGDIWDTQRRLQGLNLTATTSSARRDPSGMLRGISTCLGNAGHPHPPWCGCVGKESAPKTPSQGTWGPIPVLPGLLQPPRGAGVGEGPRLVTS